MAQSFKETAHLSIDQSKYRENYDQIFKKTEREIAESCGIPSEKLNSPVVESGIERMLAVRIEKAISILKKECHGCSIDYLPGCKKMECSVHDCIQALEGR